MCEREAKVKALQDAKRDIRLPSRYVRARSPSRRFGGRKNYLDLGTRGQRVILYLNTGQHGRDQLDEAVADFAAGFEDLFVVDLFVRDAGGHVGDATDA